MHIASKHGYFPLGLILFCVSVAVFKAASLSIEMTGSAAVLIRLFSLDLGFLALLCLAGVIYGYSESRWLRMPVKLLLSAVTIFYTIHSFVLLALDEYMSLFDLGRYLVEWQVVWSFFDVLTISVTLVFLLTIFIDKQFSRRLLTSLLVLSVVLALVGFSAAAKAPFSIQKYGLLQLGGFTAGMSGTPVVSVYTVEQSEFYSAAGPGPVEFFDHDPDIILLIVESLSSINSFKASGEKDLLRRFDSLAGEGVLFRNFFANHSASEGGIIAMLSGFPPLHYPGATPLMFDEFANQPSVMGEYRQRGYLIEFLTNADLGFIGLERYISGLDFDLARGRDEVALFAQAPRIVQNAPSDRYLYAEALLSVERLAAQRLSSARPWFLAVATASTHLPYAHPEDGEDSASAVWDWSLARLEEFHAGLQAQGFFVNGLLLITGDHRQMRPITTRETDRYGDSAKARIPLLAIGRDLPAGRIDERFFQQSDLLRMLKRIDQPALKLSPHPLWVERYNRIYGKVGSINRFSVFDEADQGVHEIPVRMAGVELSWSGDKPAFSRTLEADVHAQRSRHQFNRSGGLQGCTALYETWPPSQPGLQGLLLSVIPGKEINNLPKIEQTPAKPGPVLQLEYRSQWVTQNPSVLWFRALLEVEQAGLYWFRTDAGNQACLGIDQQLVLDQFIPGAGSQGSIELEAGLHVLDLRVLTGSQEPTPSLQWVTPGLTRWRWRDVPAKRFRLPLQANPR